MTELSFLIDLLMNHKLAKVTKELIANRIKELGELYNVKEVHIPASARVDMRQLQAPSTLAALARQGIVEPPSFQDLTNANRDPPQVEVVAQTPLAQAAMNSRQQAIAESIAGKVDKTTGRPRKF